MDEYFCRGCRKHPIWKTEAEFQAIFNKNQDAAEIIEVAFDDLSKTLKVLGYPSVINDKALEACKKDAQGVRDLLKSDDLCMQEKYNEVLKKKKNQIKFMEILKDFAKRENIEFDFNIILAKQFDSGFRKPEFSKVRMLFPELKEPCRFGEVSHSLKATESKGEKFFYLYYKRNNGEHILRISELMEELLTLAYAIQADTRVREGKMHFRK